MSKISPRTLIQPISGLPTVAMKQGHSGVIMKAAVKHTPQNRICENTLSHTLATHNSGVTPKIVLAQLDSVIVRH